MTTHGRTICRLCGVLVAECACTDHKKETTLAVCDACRDKPSTAPLAVRLYGNFLTNGSFGRVSRGLKEGLEELGLLAGCVEVDTQDTNFRAPGADARIGLYAGVPRLAAVMASQGSHRENYAILAPNSSWVPPLLVEGLQKYARIVAPSSWGAEVLARNGCPRLPPLRHGVSKGFLPDADRGQALGRAYDDGVFKVLHLSSTDRERKGTRELLLAWRKLVADKALGAEPRLEIVADVQAGTYPEAEGEPTIAMNFRRVNATVEQMRYIYQSYHLVCQPSRAEGFGLIPLEALACGVPIVATDCTGHADYLGCEDADLQRGRVVIDTGDDAPIDDGPGALAPALDVDEIASKLAHAYRDWWALYHGAQRHAEQVRVEWSWARQTKRWLDAMRFV